MDNNDLEQWCRFAAAALGGMCAVPGEADAYPEELPVQAGNFADKMMEQLARRAEEGFNA